MIRENTEWCQMYWFDTTETKLPRVLLIGDSIVVGYRDRVTAKLKGKATTAAYSTSRIVGDPAMIRELMLVLADQPIDLIYFNNGLHGFGYDDEYYRRELDRFVDLLQASSRASLHWRTSTPVTVVKDPAKPDPEKNAVVLRRNAIARKIMEARGIPCDDLYGVAFGRPELSAGDGYHYNIAGCEVLGSHVAEYIGNVLPSLK